ncbi:MAG: BrnT family toxin [Actinomycetota bacterium]
MKIYDVFDDSFAVYFDDYEHSDETEIRQVIIGKTVRYGLIVLIYIFENEKIRFITARRAEKWMVKKYEQQRKRY